MSDSEVDYLQPGFDPQTVTMPRLRSILVTHNVSYSATAKKQALVDLFSSEVAPKAKKILQQRARAKRSSLGIVDVASQPSEENDAFHADLMPPPTPGRRSRSPRKASSRQRKAEPEHEPSLPSPTKRSVRSTSRQLQASDTDTGPEPDIPRPARRTIRRAQSPNIKPEHSDDDSRSRTIKEESVFTDDNPFQSGGSSPPPIKTPATSRRKTTGTEISKGTAVSSRRRQTDGLAGTASIDAKISRSLEIPISELMRRKTPEPELIETGEEFTPEEQLELEEMEAKGETTVSQRDPRPKPRRRLNLATPLWVLTLSLLGAYAAWYRQEKIAVGYCGLGRPATQILPPSVSVPDWAVPYIEPQCEPCPPHAYCYEDLTVRCEPDFILKPHPLSLGGLVPLPPTCEPDGEKARRVKAVADKAVEELRERRAQFECGDLPEEKGQQETPALGEEELKELISQKRSKKMNRQDFDDLWASALGEVKARDEVEVIQ